MTIRKNGSTNEPGTVPDKLQPHNVEAEEAVLGSLLIDPDAVIRVATILKPEDFFIQRNGWIYEAILTLYERREPADLVILTDELERRAQLVEIGGSAYLTGLINVTPTSIHAEFYAKIIKIASGRRRLIDGAGQIARLAYDVTGDSGEAFDQAEQIIFKVTSENVSTMPKRINDPLNRVMDTIDKVSLNPGKLMGLPTGITDLDKLLGGLQRSDMITLAGRPGMGKTSLALSILLNAAKKLNKNVCMFSMEMSDEQLVQRLLSAETGIDSQRLRLGDIKNDEWPIFGKAQSDLSKMPIFIDDTPAITALELRTKARRLHAEYGLDLIIIDYLQLMNGNQKFENRQQEISYISRSIKALARELNIPILALSQLSRQVESRHDKRPMLSDLRESGGIEQDSDVVMFIYREDVYNPDCQFPNVAEIIIGKHRSGPTGIFSVYFKKRLAQFVNLELRHEQFEQLPTNGKKNGKSIPKKLDEMVAIYHNENGKNGHNGDNESFVIES